MLPAQGVPDSGPQHGFELQSEFLFNIFFPLSGQNQSMGINTIELLYRNLSCQIRVGHCQNDRIHPGEGWGPRGRQLKGRILPGVPCKCPLEGERKQE